MMKNLALLLFLLTPYLSLAQDYKRLELPNPTGKFGVGRTLFHWIDKSRPEVVTSETGDYRELLVYLFYPTEKNVRGEKAVYFPHLKEVEAFEEKFGKDFFRQSYGESYPSLSDMQTHTIENAKLSAKDRRYPVLIFSHGGGVPVLFYTAIIEELVSQGYVVAAVEHSYDGATTVFPDGRIIHQRGWGEDTKRTPQERAAFHSSRIKVGAEDDSFVLNQLEKINRGSLTEPTKQFKDRFDVSRAGALGHSLGGKIASAACQQDKRFKFCFNLDGALDAGESYDVITQPIVGMFTYRKVIQKPGETEADFLKRKTSMDKNIGNLKMQYARASTAGRLVFVDSPGFTHFSYYDFSTAQTEVFPWQATLEQWVHNKQLINAFTVAAFDTQLRSKQPKSLSLLPVEQYPEVRLDSFGIWEKADSSWFLERAINKQFDSK